MPMAAAGFLGQRAGAEAPAAMAAADPEDVGQVSEALMWLNAGGPQPMEKAEELFTEVIERWRKQGRPPGDIAQMLIYRAKARFERNELAQGELKPLLEASVVDFTEGIAGMKNDARLPAVLEDGRAAYQEYPDAYVRRGLAFEGLAQWQKAVEDYSTAIDLWGGVNDASLADVKGVGVNPFVLNFRGNALSRLGKYDEAVGDYKIAQALFSAIRDKAGLGTSLVNEALAHFGAGETEEAERLLKSAVRRTPMRSVDARVALVAVNWARGDQKEAESQWEYACNKSREGCAEFKDLTFVRDIRRWPPALVEAFEGFLRKKL